VRPQWGAGLAVAAVLVVGAAVVASVILVARPAGLPTRAVASVPALLSEPAGVLGAGLTLAPDGLGAVNFGEDENAAFAALEELLGEPVEDGPQPCQSEEDTVRFVRWGNLSVAFPDGRFGGYIIGLYYRPDSPELRVSTEEGVTLGASVSSLLSAYGDRLDWTAQEESGFAEPADGFGIDGYSTDAPSATGIGGYVEGGREEGRVITFFAGQPCGPP
jgi:hypothetical protein